MTATGRSKRSEKGDGRDSGHDDLVAVLMRRRLDVVRACGMAGFASGERRVATVEWPIGNGFVDLAIRWERRAELDDNSRSWQQSTAILIEVKSERERWSAGDVIRQHKRHRTSFLKLFPQHSGCIRMLWSDDGERYVWPVLAFFCPRELTDSEAMLFRHERFVVLPHEWAAPSLSLVSGNG